MTDWLPGTKNQHGVYRWSERLWMPRNVKGWRGIERAEICLCQLPDGWIASRGFSFWAGSHWGAWEPLTDASARHPTRELAIKAQIERLRNDFAGLSDPSMQREAAEIIAWAEAQAPAQLDLFGIAA